jgi:hypothetical protein
MSWIRSVDETIQMSFEQIVGITEWGKNLKLSDAIIESMIQPYKQAIETAYEVDMPLSKILDESDFVIGVSGESIGHGKAPVAVMAELFTEARTQIGKLTIAIIDGFNPQKRSTQKHLPLLFTNFARGSVYLGFNVETQGEAQNPIVSTDNTNATQEALKILGFVARLLQENAPAARYQEVHENPNVVDAALQAIREFTPSKKSSYNRVTIGGMSLSLEERSSTPPVFSLTSDLRDRVNLVLSRPKTPAKKTLKGAINNIDLARGEVTIKLDGDSPQLANLLHADDKVAIRKMEDENLSSEQSDNSDQDSMFE